MRFQYTLPISFLFLLAFPFITNAQPAAEAECTPTPLPTPIDTSQFACAIFHQSDEDQVTIAFEAIHRDGCVPALDQTAIIEEDRLIQISLKDGAPAGVDCVQATTYYKIETEPLMLNDGIWSVEVAYSDATGESRYTGSVEIGAPAIQPVTTAYLPIVRR